MLRQLSAAVLALSLPLAAFASATVHSLKGDAQVNGAPIFQGQVLLAEADIVTGPGAQVILHFGDGMQVALNENSRLRMVDYRYTRGPNDRAVFDLLQGGARVATGEVARTNPKQFFFRTPQAQFGVQSAAADFSVVLVNPAFLTVNAGTVLASNGAGTVAFGAGATATVATSGALAAPVAAAAFPPAASSAFGNLQVAAVAAPGSAAGGAVAGTAIGGTGLGVVTPVVFFGAAIAGAAGAFKSDDESASTTTHH
jgi:hypothetical protein